MGVPAYIGLRPAGIPHDIQQAVSAHRAADIQLSVFLQRNLHHRLGGIAPHISLAVGNRHHGAGGTAAVQLEGQGILLPLEHDPHHGGGRQQPPHSGGDHRRGLVDALRLRHDIGGIDHHRHDGGIPRQTAPCFTHSMHNSHY